MVGLMVFVLVEDMFFKVFMKVVNVLLVFSCVVWIFLVFLIKCFICDCILFVFCLRVFMVVWKMGLLLEIDIFLLGCG